MGQVIGRREETPIFYFFLFFNPLILFIYFKKLDIRAKSHFFLRKTELVVDYYQHQVRLKTQRFTSSVNPLST